MNEEFGGQSGYSIFVDALVEGTVPLWRDANGYPCFYGSREEAEREIVDDLMLRLAEYRAGERDFEDAITVEEYVMPVLRLPSGSLQDETGRIFACQ